GAPAQRIASSFPTGGNPGGFIKSSVWQDYNQYLLGNTRLYFVTQSGAIWCLDDLEVAGIANDFDKCSDDPARITPLWTNNPAYIHSGGPIGITNGVSSGATIVGSGMLLEPSFWVGGAAGGTGDFGQGTLFQIDTTNGSLAKAFVVDTEATIGDLSTSVTADALYMGTSAGRLYRINLSGSYGSLP
ncbi:MAG: hypothetical protein ACREKH_21240, partial [Candidatus Rokuibacteriota bacterium]